MNKLSAQEFRDRLREAETQLDGNPPLFVFDNHDNPRSWTRYGDGVHDLAIAKLIATLLLTPRNAALLYYGQELGMPNTEPKRKEEVRDPVGLAGWPAQKGRDGERTPMQWNDRASAGFSTASSTWLPIPLSYKPRNVAVERRDPASLFNYYRRLIQLRKENAAPREGTFALIDESNPPVLCHQRRGPKGSTVTGVLNFSRETQLVRLGEATKKAITLLSSDGPEGDGVDPSRLNLPPYGAWVGLQR